jgi:hypothetical protein
MNSDEDRSPAQRLAGLVMTFDLIPGIIGFASEYWLSGDVTSRHVGLWKACNDISCQTLTEDMIPGQGGDAAAGGGDAAGGDYRRAGITQP